MREKLKDLDIRLTELSDYLQISRPTLYKFIQMYEEGRYRGISKDVRNLFDYIEETPNIGKKNVMNYIVNSMDVEEEPLIKIISSHISRNSICKDKEQFIKNILESNMIDSLIPYFNDYFKSLKNGEVALQHTDILNYIENKINENRKQEEKEQ